MTGDIIDKTERWFAVFFWLMISQKHPLLQTCVQGQYSNCFMEFEAYGDMQQKLPEKSERCLISVNGRGMSAPCVRISGHGDRPLFRIGLVRPDMP